MSDLPKQNEFDSNVGLFLFQGESVFLTDSLTPKRPVVCLGVHSDALVFVSRLKDWGSHT